MAGGPPVAAAGRRSSRLLAGAATVVLACALLAGGAAAFSTNFVELNSSPEAVGQFPFDLGIADLDGDADLDIAVASDGSHKVTILKNNGVGNFFEPSTSPITVNGAAGIAIADLDGDADKDLAVPNTGDATVTILKNNGLARFTEPASSPEQVGEGPLAIEAADFDGDADQDLATSNITSSNVTILKNGGLGNFQQAGGSPIAVVTPVGLVAADLDGDADRDLAVANWLADPGTVTILKNNGFARFTEPATSPEPAGPTAGPWGLTAVDLDGDADRDLAVANQASHDVRILKNNGFADFIEPATSPEPVGTYPTEVAAGDFDGDGDQDLATANSATDDVTILRNLQFGNFVQPASSPELAGDGPQSIAAADLDGDGDLDLAATNYQSHNVTVLRNR